MSDWIVEPSRVGETRKITGLAFNPCCYFHFLGRSVAYSAKRKYSYICIMIVGVPVRKGSEPRTCFPGHDYNFSKSKTKIEEPAYVHTNNSAQLSYGIFEL